MLPLCQYACAYVHVCTCRHMHTRTHLPVATSGSFNITYLKWRIEMVGICNRKLYKLSDDDHDGDKMGGDDGDDDEDYDYDESGSDDNYAGD